MRGTLTQAEPYSVRAYYPPGDMWKTVHSLAYENGCVSNGYPKSGPDIRDNQAFQFPDKSSAKKFLDALVGLSGVNAVFGKGRLMEAEI